MLVTHRGKEKDVKGRAVKPFHPKLENRITNSDCKNHINFTASPVKLSVCGKHVVGVFVSN